MATVGEVIAAARSWIGTAYHHMARVKGAGVDCGQLLIAAFEEAGAVSADKVEAYTSDWHLHRDENRYLEVVERYLQRVEGDTELSIAQRLAEDPSWTAPSASVIVFQIGRCFSHGAIVTFWPNIVHAYLPSGIVEEVSIIGTPMSAKKARVYQLEGLK